MANFKIALIFNCMKSSRVETKQQIQLAKLSSTSSPFKVATV